MPNSRLPVVGADDDRVAVEEVVEASGGLRELEQGRVGALEGALCVVGACGMRRVVVVGEVVDEEVEPVARHQPAAGVDRVAVDGAGRAGANGERRPRLVRLVEVEEEEAARAVDGLVPAVAPRELGKPDAVARAASVAREGDGAGDEPGILDRLEHRRRLGREVRGRHVEHRVTNHSPDAGREHRAERRAVLDHPLLLGVPPDDVRNAVHVRPAPCRDGAQADRGDGRERAHPARVLALRSEVGQHRQPSVLDPSLQRGRREPVDHAEDELLAHEISVGAGSHPARPAPAGQVGAGSHPARKARSAAM